MDPTILRALLQKQNIKDSPNQDLNVNPNFSGVMGAANPQGMMNQPQNVNAGFSIPIFNPNPLQQLQPQMPYQAQPFNPGQMLNMPQPVQGTNPPVKLPFQYMPQPQQGTKLLQPQQQQQQFGAPEMKPSQGTQLLPQSQYTTPEKPKTKTQLNPESRFQQLKKVMTK